MEMGRLHCLKGKKKWLINIEIGIGRIYLKLYIVCCPCWITDIYMYGILYE